MTALKVYNFSAFYLPFLGSLIIAISCLFLFRMRAKYLKVLGFYSVSSIAFSIAQNLAAKSSNGIIINTIGNAFVLNEALLLGTLFYLTVISKSFKLGILMSLSLFVIYFIIVFVFFEDHVFSYVRIGRDLLMILYAISYFFYLIRKLPEEDLLKFPMFWINSAIIFFFSGTFILSFFRDYIVSILKDDMTGFWAFRNFFRFAFCLVLAYAGWLDLRTVLKSKTV